MTTATATRPLQGRYTGASKRELDAAGSYVSHDRPTTRIRSRASGHYVSVQDRHSDIATVGRYTDSAARIAEIGNPIAATGSTPVHVTH